MSSSPPGISLGKFGSPHSSISSAYSPPLGQTHGQEDYNQEMAFYSDRMLHKQAQQMQKQFSHEHSLLIEDFRKLDKDYLDIANEKTTLMLESQLQNA